MRCSAVAGLAQRLSLPPTCTYAEFHSCRISAAFQPASHMYVLYSTQELMHIVICLYQRSNSLQGSLYRLLGFIEKGHKAFSIHRRGLQLICIAVVRMLIQNTFWGICTLLCSHVLGLSEAVCIHGHCNICITYGTSYLMRFRVVCFDMFVYYVLSPSGAGYAAFAVALAST
jgi:hypothetical protein